MKTSTEKWKAATQNLIKRRAVGVQDNKHCEGIVANYGRHLRSFEPGKSLLDVGCGDQSIKRLLAENYPGVRYTGIDPFPVNDQVLNYQIEKINVKEFEKEHGEQDTVICFAALDSMQDLKKATANMKKLAKKNIVFLTGIDIEPDQYHTFKITEALLHELMDGWAVHMSNYLTPKVLLIEYRPQK